MIYNLTIATLEGCNFCNKFKDLLLSERIKFNEVLCSSNSGLCDYLESNTGCDMYPMSIIDTDNGLRIITCVTSDYQKINTTSTINKKTGIIYFHSINTMLDYIKNI
jgi:glutaredoxin